MAGRTSSINVNDPATMAMEAHINNNSSAPLVNNLSSNVISHVAASASLTTATTTVSAIRDVSTASGRPSRRDQLNSTNKAATAAASTTASAAAAASVANANHAARTTAAPSRSYAGSPTGQYPPAEYGNVPQSISTSAFTVGTSRYNR